MKKINLFTLAVFTSFLGFAQDQPMGSSSTPMLRTAMATTTRFGIRGGVNLASLEIDDDNNATKFNSNMKTSFHLGAFVNIPIGGMFRLQPEVSYVGQGSKIDGTLLSNASVQESYELDYHYIAVPILAQLQTAGGFFVEAGPQIAFMIKAREDRGTGDDADLEDLLRKTDFALAGGIGYLSRIGLGVNARYVHGLSNVYNNDAAGRAVRDAEVSNRGIQLGLTYHFGANK